MQTGQEPSARPIEGAAAPASARPIWGPGERLTGLVWLAGAGGFFGAFLLAPHTAQPNSLRLAGLGWFALFGVLNAILVLRQGRAP
jgi:hypothetical protein